MDLRKLTMKRYKYIVWKFISVFVKTPRYSSLNLYNDSINGNYVNFIEDPAIVPNQLQTMPDN